MTEREENHLDQIIRSMGELKMFTILQTILMTFVAFPAASQLLSNVFICREVKHICAPSPNESSLLLSGLDGYDYNDLSISYQQCQIVVSYNDTVLKTEECIYGMAYDKPKDFSCISQFNLVCDRSSLAKLSQTLVIAGQGIGAAFFTFLCDKIGRMPILVLSNAGLLVSGLAVAYAPNYGTFAVFKFAAGAFQQGCLTSCSTLLMEILTKENRRIQACYSGVMWGISVMTLALWGYLFRDMSWRTLQMVFSITSVTFIIQLRYLKESLRWLIANGKTKSVTSYIRHATKVNKTSFEKTMKVYEEVCHLKAERHEGKNSPETGSKDATNKQLTLFDVLKVKRMFVNMAIMWFAWFTTSLSFFAIYLMATSLAGDPYINFFLTALMEIPNNFVLFYLLNRFGRKASIFIVFLVVSVGLTVCGVFRCLEQNSINSAFALVFSCLGMAGSSAAFAIVFFYTAEIFPTNARNQAVGVSSLVGRIGGMIAPFSGLLSEKAKWAPGVMIGGCALIVCCLSLVLPETRNRELPHTIEDVTAWFAKGDTKTDTKLTNMVGKTRESESNVGKRETASNTES